jgi:hypothetical protein
MLVCAGSADATSANDVNTKIAELITALTDFDGKGDVSAKISELRTKIIEKQLIGFPAATEFQQDSQQIQKVLNDPALRQQVQAQSRADGPIKTAILDLLKALDKLNEDTVVQDRFVELTSNVKRLIEASRSNRVILIEALLVENPPANSAPAKIQLARKDLETALGTITQRPRIHVIRSWYGDLRTRWSEGRLCDATLALRKDCEEKTMCTVQSVTADALCGYDPALQADPVQKGAAVEFACVFGSADTWDAVAQRPGINPVTGQPWRTEEKNVQTVRSSSMQLRCPYPVQ